MKRQSVPLPEMVDVCAHVCLWGKEMIIYVKWKEELRDSSFAHGRYLYVGAHITGAIAKWLDVSAFCIH